MAEKSVPQVLPTPVPWHVGPYYKTDIESAHGHVAECGITRGKQAEVNAEFIVRCVNSHQALVDLLTAIAKDKSAYQWHTAIANTFSAYEVSHV